LSDIPIVDIKRFEKEILEFIEVKYNDIFEAIKKEKVLIEETEAKLKKAAEEFLNVFKKSV
jgi:F-type H+-transporting ATPase subunit alpha